MKTRITITLSDTLVSQKIYYCRLVGLLQTGQPGCTLSYSVGACLTEPQPQCGLMSQFYHSTIVSYWYSRR